MCPEIIYIITFLLQGFYWLDIIALLQRLLIFECLAVSSVSYIFNFKITTGVCEVWSQHYYDHANVTVLQAP